MLSNHFPRKAGSVVHSRILAASLSAVAVLATQGSPASAQTASLEATSAVAGPVVIEQFSVAASAGKFSRPTIFLSFRNVSVQLADEVRFLVRYRGGAATVVDKGVFSPGIAIHHQFSAPFGAPTPGDVPTGAVQYVHFADGTHWGAL